MKDVLIVVTFVMGGLCFMMFPIRVRPEAPSAFHPPVCTENLNLGLTVME